MVCKIIKECGGSNSMNKFSYVKKILYLLIAILILQSKNIEPAGENITPIYTQKDLEFISNNLDGNFILMNDITISGIWDPIGSNEWTPRSKNFKGVQALLSQLI